MRAATGLNVALSARVDLADRHPIAGPVLFYGGLAVFGLLGCLLGLHRALRDRPGSRATLWRAALLLPVAAATAVALAVRFARSMNYHDTPGVVATECGIVVVLCAASLFVARRWALGRTAT